MVQSTGNVDRCPFLIFDQLENVLFRRIQIGTLSHEFDLGTSWTFLCKPGDVDLDVEFRFQCSSRLTTTANQQAMLFWCNVKSLRCFAFPLLDEAFNRGYDLVNDGLAAFNMDAAVA